jgi:16S rRNA (guanine966-N2)-methyltransferase
MRITSGILKNRRFEVPQQAVRPTKEAVREAVFSSLGGRCDGLRVLDLYAGAGSLGLEAWSRGAESVTFVEQDSAVCAMLQENIRKLACDGLGETRCIRADAIEWLERAGERFDLILADPPYDLPDAMVLTLDGIAGHSVLTDTGTVVYELRSEKKGEPPRGWDIRRDRKYGKTRVLMLQRKSEEES